MKRVIVLLLIASAAAAFLWHRNHVAQTADPPLPADPAAAVDVFMGTMAKLSALMWDEERRQQLAEEAGDLQHRPEAEARTRAKDIWDRYGLKSPLYLFADPAHGKAVQATLLLVRFESYEVTPAESAETAATVDASFTPADVLGIGDAIERLGAPSPLRQTQAVTLTFHLERHGDGWRITATSGTLQGTIDAFHRVAAHR